MSSLPPTHPLSEDRGFLLGDGLFETLRLYGDHPFRLEAHLSRLRTGALRIGIPLPEGIEAEVSEALEAWREGSAVRAHARDGAMRITLTRGAGAGILPPATSAPTLVVTTSEYEPDPEVARRGLKACILGRVDERALTSGLKAIGYLERIVALREARLRGADEALLVNGQGRLVEGSASNLFALVDGVLRTPGVEEGALPGITRGVVLDVARALGIPSREAAPSRVEVARAGEVFLTSSLREVAPVVEIEGRAVGDGRPGRTFHALAEGFREIVALERSS